MRTSDKTTEIIAALHDVSMELKNPVAVADNPFYKSKYTPLDYLIDHIKKVTNARGLFIVQEAQIVGNMTTIVTRLTHISGEWIETDLSVPSGADPQKQGASITYARRYALSALFNIASDMDNDANETVEKSGDKIDNMPSEIRQLFIEKGYKDRNKVRLACESCHWDWKLIKKNLEGQNGFNNN